jgi:cell division septal protein FtsQ
MKKGGGFASSFFHVLPYSQMLSFFTKKQPYVLERKKPVRRLSPFHLQIIIGVVIALSLALLITAVWYVSNRPSFQIIDVDVVGGVTIPHSVVKETVEAGLVGNYMRIIPKRFIPFYPQDAVAQRLMEVPRMKNVHVEHVGDQKLVVAFDEYVPFGLWCEAKDSKNCLFIDTAGFAFTSAPALEGSAFVRYVDMLRKPELKVSSFDEAFIKNTTKFAELLRDSLSLYVTHVEKIGGYDIEYTIAGGGVIKVAERMSPEETFSNLKTILESKEFSHIEPGAFQYIDLRFGDKVFVSEAPVATATTTASTTSINE